MKKYFFLEPIEFLYEIVYTVSITNLKNILIEIATVKSC
jgi:hypothetical protein